MRPNQALPAPIHQTLAKEEMFPVRYLTLLGLGLIKINDVSANFNNPRHTLILNN